MTVHAPDNIQKILEDDEEINSSNNVSSDAQKTGSSNPVNPVPNFDNVLQVFQNTQVTGILARLMTH